MQKVDTYWATIFMGSKPGYDSVPLAPMAAFAICSEYCNEVKLGVTIKQTHFIYVDGDEPGFEIGLINYPRFPSTKHDIYMHAMTLGKKLMEAYQQERFSIVFPDETVMFEKEDL